MHTRPCAVLRLRCLAQGRCGVAVAGMVLLGIQEPRHVFRPPAGKYTFNATESAGAGGAHRIHDHFRWFCLKRRGCEGLFGRFSVSAHEDCTLPYTTWKPSLYSSEDWRVSIWRLYFAIVCHSFSRLISRSHTVLAGSLLEGAVITWISI